jgi:gentisate 1,2-dioxygenase
MRRGFVPGETPQSTSNTGDRPTFLFNFSDAPVMKASSLYGEQTGA